MPRKKLTRTQIIKYWKKISNTAFEPLAHDNRSLQLEMQHRPELAWCKDCDAAIEPEGCLDQTGLSSVCPFCGLEVF